MNPELIQHLLYGDIEEMPLSILGSDCPDAVAYAAMDQEEQTRFQAAATVQAWMEGRLHRSGYLFDPAMHGPWSLIGREEG